MQQTCRNHSGFFVQETQNERKKTIHRQVTGLSEEKPPVPLQATLVLYVEGAPVAGWWRFASPKAQCH